MADLQALAVCAHDSIVTVTMNRPEKLNALSTRMWDELHAVLADLTENAAVRVVVLTGAGGNFCSGADLQELAEGLPIHELAQMRKVTETLHLLHELPKPTIAKVSGAAYGGGCNLALMCDLVVASTTARFAEIFSHRGLSIDSGGSWILPRLVGLHRAKELVLFGAMLSAADAYELGLVNRVLDPEAIDAFVEDWASSLAAGPAVALAQTKRLLNVGMTSTLLQAMFDEATVQAVNLVAPDAAEGIESFLDKRPARFSGAPGRE